MPDLAPELPDVEDRDPGEEPPIRGLAAPFGIEDRVGENGERAAILLSRCEDLGIQLGPLRVALESGKDAHARSESTRAM
jgi:hypothetical protein